MDEQFQIFLLFSGMSLAIMAVASFVLHYFIALKSVPVVRAAWTSGATYLLMMIITYFGEGYGSALEEREFLINLGVIASAIIIFLYWWYDFRKSWYENPNDMTEGQALANDDWRIGLLTVGIFIVAGIAKAILRTH